MRKTSDSPTPVYNDVDTSQLWRDKRLFPPNFNRTHVAKILNCTPMTVASRENKGIYPVPKRVVSSNHRYYTLQDVFYLQYLTSGSVDVNIIASSLWDLGLRSSDVTIILLTQELAIFKNFIEKKHPT